MLDYEDINEHKIRVVEMGMLIYRYDHIKKDKTLNDHSQNDSRKW